MAARQPGRTGRHINRPVAVYAVCLLRSWSSGLRCSRGWCDGSRHSDLRGSVMPMPMLGRPDFALGHRSRWLRRWVGRASPCREIAAPGNDLTACGLRVVPMAMLRRPNLTLGGGTRRLWRVATPASLRHCRRCWRRRGRPRRHALRAAFRPLCRRAKSGHAHHDGQQDAGDSKRHVASW